MICNKIEFSHTKTVALLLLMITLFLYANSQIAEQIQPELPEEIIEQLGIDDEAQQDAEIANIEHEIENEINILEDIRTIAPQVTDEEFTEATVTGKDLQFNVEIPHIGTFLFKGKVDLTTQNYHFTGTLQKAEKTRIGPLFLNITNAEFSSEKWLQISGIAKLFNKYDFTIQLEEFIQGQEVSLELSTEAPLTIPLTPWKRIAINKLYLSFTDETPTLSTPISLFSTNDCEITIGLNNLAGFAELTIQELSLSKIVPLFKNTIFDTIVTKNIKISLDNFIRHAPILTLTGTTDFSRLAKTLPVKLDLVDLVTTLEISALGNIKFSAKSQQDAKIKPFKGIPVLDGIELSNLGLGINLRPLKFFVEGTCSILNVPFRGQLHVAPKGIILKAFLDDGWKLTNIFPQARGTFIEDMKMFGGALILSTKHYFDPELNIQMVRGINVVADVPFWEFMLGFVKDEKALFVLKNMPPFMFIPDRVKVFGSLGLTFTSLSLQMILSKRQVDILTIPNGPSLKGGNLALYINGAGPTIGGKLELIVKPVPEDDPLAFAGAIELNGLMLDVSGSMLGTWNNPLGIATRLGLKKEGLAIENVGIEVGYDLKKILALLMTIVTGGVTLVSGGGTAASGGGTVVSGGGTVVGTGGTVAGAGGGAATAVTGVGAAAGGGVAAVSGTGTVIGGAATVATGAGTVVGSGASVISGGATATSAIGTVTSWLTGLLPNNFGITGTLKVGEAVTQVTTQLSTDFWNTTLIAKLIREATDPKTGYVNKEMIRLQDLLYFARDLGIQIPPDFIKGVEKMGEFGLMGELYFCPLGTKIGQIFIDPGITFAGQASIPNPLKILDPQQGKSLFAKIELSLSLDGIIAKGGLPKIRIGDLFEISGAGYDKIAGTDDDGPTFSFEISLNKQEFFISGNFKALSNLGPLGSSGEIEIRFDLEKAKLLIKTTLAGEKVSLELRAESIGQSLLMLEDFIVHGHFKDDFKAFLENGVRQIAYNVKQGVTEKLLPLEQKLQEEEEKVKKLTEEVNKLYKERAHGLGGYAVVKLKNAQREVDKINNEIDALQKQHDSIKVSWANLIQAGAQQAALKANIAAKWVAHKAAMVALQAAKIAVGTVSGNLDAEITKKETELFAARESLRLARTAVGLARKTVTDVADLGASTIAELNKIFTLRKVELDFSLMELLQKGKLPKLAITATVLGKNIKGEVQADFTQPDKLFRDIFNIIQQFLK